MVAIADKFGKASKSNLYASATTVKTARIAGVGVLEAFDLSKFAIDTPVFFITYKKTIDPVTNVVSIVSQVSWKALVNDVNNTLTNLTVAPGYTDLGNDVGDFIECIPTSYWETSLIDALLTSLNPDGTLKTAAVKTALGNDGNLVQTLDEVTADMVLSGGIWTSLTGLNAGMSAVSAYIDGYKNTVAAVATRLFTASRDTYIDLLRNTGTNAFSLVYTEVVNNAAAPALAANSVRLGIVVTSGSAITRIVQTGFDSLGGKIRYTGIITGAQAPGLWWEEIARVKATSISATLDTGTFIPRKYMKFIFFGAASGGSYAFGVRFNGDAGANYADALLYGSGASAGYSQTGPRNEIRASTTIPSGGSFYHEAEILNFQSINKQFQGRATSDQGGGIVAGFAPDNQLFSGKWVNTATLISSIQIVKLGGTSGMGIDSEMIVLGHD